MTETVWNAMAAVGNMTSDKNFMNDAILRMVKKNNDIGTILKGVQAGTDVCVCLYVYVSNVWVYEALLGAYNAGKGSSSMNTCT